MKEAKEKFYENPRMKIQEKERSFEKQLEDKILEKYEDIKLQIRLRNLEKFISTLISSLMKFLNDKRTLSVGSLTLLLLMVKALMRRERR